MTGSGPFVRLLAAPKRQRIKRKVLPRGSQASAAGGRFIALASQGKCTLDRRRECFADKKEGTLISNFVPVQILGWCRVRTGISLLHFKSQAVPLIVTADPFTANVARQIDPWLSVESTSQKLDQQVPTVRF